MSEAEGSYSPLLNMKPNDYLIASHTVIDPHIL